MSNYTVEVVASGIAILRDMDWPQDDFVRLANQYLIISAKEREMEAQIVNLKEQVKNLTKVNGDQVECIAKLRAVIADVPELFALVTRRSDDGDEYYEANTDSEPTNKSDLLKKHGVEV